MRQPESWQEWLRIEAGHACDYFNDNRAACETILGPVLHRENRLTTIRDNDELGAEILRGLQQHFHLPHHALLAGALPYYGEILDAFWSGSYLAHGTIGDESFEESMRAGLSYLRNFLPDVMAARDEPQRAKP